jgi:hypothetical protein
MDAVGVFLDVVGAIALIVSLIAVARSNKRVAASVRMSNLQSMTVEMNGLRRLRADDPALERSLFETRTSWSDLQIKHNLMAVQLANILEWAYLARREGMIEIDVWESWVGTWRSVIVSSQPLRNSLGETVWTFGRSPEMTKDLGEIISGSDSIPDPFVPPAKVWSWLTGL